MLAVMVVMVALLAGCGSSVNGEKYAEAWADALCACWEEDGGWADYETCYESVFGPATEGIEDLSESCLPEDESEAAWAEVDAMLADCDYKDTVLAAWQPNQILITCD